MGQPVTCRRRPARRCQRQKERAAGEPAAEATGRHHNVREDIGLNAARLTWKVEMPASTFKPLKV
jgi:hypothetical protein